MCPSNHSNEAVWAAIPRFLYTEQPICQACTCSIFASRFSKCFITQLSCIPTLSWASVDTRTMALPFPSPGHEAIPYRGRGDWFLIRFQQRHKLTPHKQFNQDQDSHENEPGSLGLSIDHPGQAFRGTLGPLGSRGEKRRRVWSWPSVNIDFGCIPRIFRHRREESLKGSLGQGRQEVPVSSVVQRVVVISEMASNHLVLKS